MKRNKLVILESLLIIIIFVGIVFIVFSGYFVFKGLGRTILNVNDNNRLEIEKMLKESSYYDTIYNINDLNKIEFFLAFDNYEFKLYYKNGEEKEIYDDSLENLSSYIKENGYCKDTYYIIIDIILIIMCLVVNSTRKKISNKIDLIDKEDECK